MSDGAKGGAGQQQWSEGPPLPRWVFWLMVPGMIAPVLIFGFIVFDRSAHDAERCPFQLRARREVAAGVTVIEEARNCVGTIEEHRYSLLRSGQPLRLLGERSFDRQAFGKGYRVTPELTPQGDVQIIVHNDGHDDLLFREGTAREHERGISLGHRSAKDEAARTKLKP